MRRRKGEAGRSERATGGGRRTSWTSFGRAVRGRVRATALQRETHGDQPALLLTSRDTRMMPSGVRARPRTEASTSDLSARPS